MISNKVSINENCLIIILIRFAKLAFIKHNYLQIFYNDVTRCYVKKCICPELNFIRKITKMTLYIN